MGKMTHAAAAAALAALPMAVATANAQEAPTSPITTTQSDTGPSADVTLRVHAATLADDQIRFTELPEVGANITLTDNLRFSLSGNILTPPGENLLTAGLGETDFRVGDAFLGIRLNDSTKLNIGQFEFAYGQDFGEAWVQSGVGPAAPQILDESSFSAHAIPELQGAQIEHTVHIDDNESVYLTGVAGNNFVSDDLQGMALARYTRTNADGGSLSLTGQYMSRAAGDGTETGLFGIAQIRQPVSDGIAVRGDIEIGTINDVGGVRGEDGTYMAARGFMDFTHNDRFTSYLGVGTFREAAGGSYQAIEGGAAYKFTDNLTGHAGIGYADGGFAEGVSTTLGLTYNFRIP